MGAEDRWCNHCNAYQTARACAHCARPTEEVLVWNPQRKAKLRCACRAPFEGLRPVNESGLALSLEWEGRLDEARRQLTVDVVWRPERVIEERLASDSYVPKPLACPHCGTPLLLARVRWPGRLPIVGSCKLITRPDQSVLLQVQAAIGVHRGT